jgi:starvation-inducible DNA-binding protein
VNPRAVADDLQALLVEVIDLALISKQANWVLGRSLFDPVRAQLDDLAADARGWADEFGERLAALGVPPDGRTETVAERARFTSFPAGFVDDAEILALIRVRLNEIIEDCPRRIARLKEWDPVSESLLLDMTAALVKHRWVFAPLESDLPSPLDFAPRRPRTARG